MSELKRSFSLVLAMDDDAFIAFDYVSGEQFECDLTLVSFLNGFVGWVAREDAERRALQAFGEQWHDILQEAVDIGCLLERDGPSHRREIAFQAEWRWGMPAALMHTAVTRRPVNAIEEQETFQKAKAARENSPPLVYEPTSDANVVSLPVPERSRGMFKHLERRRTCREGCQYTLPTNQLSDILFAGLGVTGWTSNCVGRLPLKYAPSGGARSPFDAYVLAQSVDGLEPGLFRYSGVRHTLDQAAPLPNCSIGDLFGGQDWTDDAACAIFLVAEFGRSMWKYEGDDNAYRVVMIEAGHIAQNMMLLAASHGLSASPSAALDHELIETAIGETRFDRSPIYGLALLKPATALT